MSSEDRIRWDNAYRQRLHRAYPSPDPLLLQFTPPLDKALGNKVSDAEAQDDENSHTPDNLEESVTRALDLAAGWGQNGLWLAEQGYNVDIMDISRVALQRARAEMAVRNLRNINLLQMDVDDLQLEPEQYDLLCVFRYLKRHLFPLLKLTTRSGGRIIYETFNRRYLEIVPDFNQDYLLEIGELRSFFSNWQIRHYEETDHNARIVAIKPH